MNHMLTEYIKQVQDTGAVQWAAIFERDYGITLSDLQKIAEREITSLEEALPEEAFLEKLHLALVGGLFLGLASMISYQNDLDKMNEELENFGNNEQE